MVKDTSITYIDSHSRFGLELANSAFPASRDDLCEKCGLGCTFSRCQGNAENEGAKEDAHIGKVEDTGSHRANTDAEEINDTTAVEKPVDEITGSPGDYEGGYSSLAGSK